MEEFRLERLTLQFAESTAPVLRNVSLTLKPGTISLVCGPNGSGKTVLLRACLALERPSTGTVRIDGIDVVSDPKPLYRRSATVFQNPETQIFGTTVAEEIAFSLGPREALQEEDAAILRKLGISDLMDRAPATLSGGQRQRLALAGALLSRPEILFLDEPVSALDYPYIRKLIGILREYRDRGTAILATMHDIRDLWNAADQILLLNEGRSIFYGAPAEAISFITPAYGMRPVEERSR